MIARIINTVLGLWLMAAPWLLGYGGVARKHDDTIGPLIATFAIIAMWEVTRPLRRVNTVLGLWLIVAPWLLGFPPIPTINGMLVGAVVTLCSLHRGKLTHRYGGGWRSLWRDEMPGETGT